MLYRQFPFVIALAVLLGGLQANAGTPGTARIDPVGSRSFMPVKDIKPGMRGYGKTVFRGTKIETFEVEVLGVLKKVNLGTDLILVKLKGGPMTTRGANIIQGMSGSPVYINGKLAGAFAYGEAFVKEPIGMVTPIENMLDAWDPALPSKPSSFFPFGASNLDQPLSLGGKQFGRVAVDYGSEDDRSYGSDTLVFRPLATPVLVSGMSPRITSWLKESLKSLNLVPVAGPGLAADKTNLSVDIQPGSAVGVSLVTGDMDVTMVGTTTYRQGNKIVAFGHPMFANPMMYGIGPIDAPLTSAYVYDVNPSLFVSSKIAAPIKPIGRVFQDRPWSIGGEIGKLPQMVPVAVHVNDRSLGRKRDFNVKVVNHPILSPTFILGAAAEAVFEMRGSPSDATANVKLEVTADEVGTIVRENTFFDPMSIDMTAVTELQQVLNLLQFNRFYPVGIKKVQVWVDIVPKHQTAKLERVYLKESKFKPGDTVEVTAVLRPYKGERVTRTIKLQLPKNMPDGRVSVQVRGGTAGIGPDAPMMPMLGGPGMQQPMPATENLQQLIKKYLERDKNNDLVAKIQLPKPVPCIAGEKLSGLPPSIADALKSPKATALGTERDEIKEVISTEWVLSGVQTLSITVQKEQKSERKSPSSREAEPPAAGAPEAEAPAPSAPEEEMPEETEEDLYLSAYQSGAAPGPLAPEAPAEGDYGNNSVIQPAEQGGDAKGDEQPSDEADEHGEMPQAAGEKPLARQPSVWKQTSRNDFRTGSLRNVAATTGDLLVLAASIEPLYESGETYAWCVLPDGKGNVYIGTGNHGIVYKVAGDGSASVLFDSTELEVHSLALGPDGSVYVGTSPNGLVYKIGPDGKATTLLDAEEKYIIALATDGKGNVYAAAGDKCKVYRISPDGKVATVLDSSEQHTLSLAVDRDDNIYIGTGLSGIVYKVSPDGRATVLYDAAEDSVTALAVGPSGVLFAGTSPKGAVYKLAPGSTPKAIYSKADKGIVGLALNGSDVYAATAESIYRIMPDETVATLDNEHDLQIMSIAISGGRLFAGTGNIGSVYSAGVGSITEGTYESPVHDCGSVSNLGIIDWTADLPKGTSVALQTRTGLVAEPDSTWSDWSALYTTPGARIASQPGRYIQYLATLKTEGPAVSPKVKDISIFYLPKNQSPKVTLTSPKGGEKWSKNKTIKWRCSDPDKDTLYYELFYSSDGGVTWHPLGDRIRPATAEKKEEPQNDEQDMTENGRVGTEAITIDAPSPQQMLEQMAAELDKHPEIPQEMKDMIMAQAPAIVAEEMEAAAAEAENNEPADQEPATPKTPSGNGTKLTRFKWDTSRFLDGSYLIKVVGSDRLSNPVDALTGEAVSEPIMVVNSAPRVKALKKTLTVQADRSVRLEGVACQNIVGIAGVQYRVDSGDWAAAAASDGIFDSQFEVFTITTLPLDKGERIIEVKAIDQAGNSATTRITSKVE